MRHDWILDVLAELRVYAQKNNLPETAEGADVLLRLARAEVAAQSDDDAGGNGEAPGQGGGGPRRGLPH